jgi:4-hydroxybenzoate polyprenyltransferase
MSASRREETGLIPEDGVLSARSPRIICVDLDGSLVRTDTLVEGLLESLRNPRDWAGLWRSVLRGRAALKRQLTIRTSLDPALLPYEQTLIDYLQTQRECGRRLVLATAADRMMADGVNAHLKLFDEVIASDGARNLKGPAKSDALVKRFGAGNFTYVGNSRPDLHVWRHAGSAIVVNAPRRLSDKVAEVTRVERSIDERSPRAASFLKALRPHQWLKNVLVFLPLLTANALRDGRAWIDTAVMFVAFCVAASAVYLINDLTDLSADRGHPQKRRRPFASGDLSLTIGIVAAPLLIGLGVALAFTIGTARIIALYVACSLAYSVKGKKLPLVDVFMLAFLYTVRVFGGAEASHYHLSPWFLTFSIFLFLGLATVKRVGELMDLKRRGMLTTARRGYDVADISILQTMGVGSSFVAAMVLALFIQSSSVAARYERPELLWLAVPLVLFWQCWLWLSTARGLMHSDPIVYAVRDWVSWLTAATALVVFILARGFYSPAG